jgi:ubiquinone/menaquinone biosynthesis C-methylase UbiE
MEKNKMTLDWSICKKRVSDIGLNDNSRILDIGSKDGKKANYVIKTGQLLMSDMSKRKNVSPLVLLDATHLPFNDNSFDLVTIFHVLEHIEKGETALSEIYRVLKKGGTTLIVTPNGDRFTKVYSIILKFITRSPYKYPLNHDHVFEYNNYDISSVMQHSKFENYVIEPIFMKISRVLRIRKWCDQWIVTSKK